MGSDADVSNKIDANDTNHTHNDGRSIIDIIKENMVNEKEYNAEIINILKEQIIYFKNEIIHENTLIENLIIELNTHNNDLLPTYQQMSQDKTTSQCESTSLSSDNTDTENRKRQDSNFCPANYDRKSGNIFQLFKFTYRQQH